MKKRMSIIASSIIGGYALYKFINNRRTKEQSLIFQRRPLLSWKPMARMDMLKTLSNKHFDLLIIGGGSVGAGCALDAATRGLNVALVEGNDFGSETSSKSTKLLHGGIRYLEKALKKFDLSQFFLVREALSERKIVMENMPHLSRKLPFLLPVYDKLMVPYFYMGMKFYDWISGSNSLGSSKFLDKNETIKQFPEIRKEALQGSIVYYDGQFNDARANVMLALTASYYGAIVSNYTTVTKLISKNDIVTGAVCKDEKSGKIFKIKAKGVINATGPFIDTITKLEGNKTKPLVAPSSGVHLILPKEFAPKGMGYIQPKTSDGRVLFFIPWQNKALVGTTDNNCTVKRHPTPTDEEIDFLINEIKDNISFPETLSRKIVLSAWTGIRPLVRDPKSVKTESLVRNHLIFTTPSKVITVCGGKWTTYRRMAQETIDRAIKEFNLIPKRGCMTTHVKVLGSHGYKEDLYLKLMRDLNVSRKQAKFMSERYGDRAYILGDCKNTKIINTKYYVLEKEIEYMIDYEMALSISDILCRRLRLGFIDVVEAEKCIKPVSNIMKKKLGWSKKMQIIEEKNCREYLNSLGLSNIKKYLS